MRPRYRAWGVERYPGLKQPAPKMHRNVSVVTTYPEGITFVLTDFSMWGDDEYSGSIIDEAILMQSTGILDKNGQEIFEGDILEIQGIRMVVKFGSYEYIESSKNNVHTLGVVYDGLGFYVECINAADPDRISPFEPETLKESAVIGNVYENKELLEDGK